MVVDKQATLRRIVILVQVFSLRRFGQMLLLVLCEWDISFRRLEALVGTTD